MTREVLEESGLVINNPGLHGLLLFTNFKGNDWHVFVYTATDFTAELIDSPEGKLEWIANDELTSLNLWGSDHIFFPWIEDGKFFSAKFAYDGDTMWSSIPNEWLLTIQSGPTTNSKLRSLIPTANWQWAFFMLS